MSERILSLLFIKDKYSVITIAFYAFLLFMNHFPISIKYLMICSVSSCVKMIPNKISQTVNLNCSPKLSVIYCSILLQNFLDLTQ